MNWVTICSGNGLYLFSTYPDSKVHGANMGPIWGRQDPGGPHVGPMNFDIWVVIAWFNADLSSIGALEINVCKTRTKIQ